MKKNNLPNSLINIGILIVTIIGAVMLLLLTGFSFLETEVFGGYDKEILVSTKDNWLLHLFVLLMISILLTLKKWFPAKWSNKIQYKMLFKLIQNKQIHIFAGIVTLLIAICGCVWVAISKCMPSADQAQICNVASQFLSGDYSEMLSGGYMELYPQQYSTVFLLEIIFKCFGGYVYQPFQYMNAILAAFAFYMGFRVTDELFENKKVNLLFVIIGICFLPFYLYIPYVYGEVGSTAFVLCSVWLFCRYFRTNKIRYGVFLCISSALAVAFRKNSLIFIITLAICFIFKALQYKEQNKKWYIPLLLGFIIACSSQGLLFAAREYYEAKSGIETDAGMPASLFIAMGLTENENGPGWYSHQNVLTYYSSENNPDKANELGKEQIKNQLDIYQENPGQALDFFRRKLQSQWNEPTYEAFWSTHCFAEPGRFNWKLYDSSFNQFLIRFLDEYQLCVYLMALFAIVGMRDCKHKIEKYVLAITFIGGFLFSMLWEAKSRYCVEYIVFLLPYMAFGIWWLGNQFGKLGKSREENSFEYEKQLTEN